MYMNLWIIPQLRKKLNIKDLNMWPIGHWNTKIWPIMPNNPP